MVPNTTVALPNPQDENTRRAGGRQTQQHDGVDENQMSIHEVIGSDSTKDDTTNNELDALTDPSGRVYSQADVSKAKLEKYPTICAWFRENRSVFEWLEAAFLELAGIATGAEISGNLLVYFLRYTGVKDGQGRRQRRYVQVSNNVNPLLSRVLGILHPEHASKLSTSPCIWDVPALQPLVQELAELA